MIFVRKPNGVKFKKPNEPRFIDKTISRGPDETGREPQIKTPVFKYAR